MKILPVLISCLPAIVYAYNNKVSSEFRQGDGYIYAPLNAPPQKNAMTERLPSSGFFMDSAKSCFFGEPNQDTSLASYMRFMDHKRFNKNFTRVVDGVSVASFGLFGEHHKLRTGYEPHLTDVKSDDFKVEADCPYGCGVTGKILETGVTFEFIPVKIKSDDKEHGTNNCLEVTLSLLKELSPLTEFSQTSAKCVAAVFKTSKAVPKPPPRDLVIDVSNSPSEDTLGARKRHEVSKDDDSPRISKKDPRRRDDDSKEKKSHMKDRRDRRDYERKPSSRSRSRHSDDRSRNRSRGRRRDRSRSQDPSRDRSRSGDRRRDRSRSGHRKDKKNSKKESYHNEDKSHTDRDKKYDHSIGEGYDKHKNRSIQKDSRESNGHHYKGSNGNGLSSAVTINNHPLPGSSRVLGGCIVSTASDENSFNFSQPEVKRVEQIVIEEPQSQLDLKAPSNAIRDAVLSFDHHLRQPVIVTSHNAAKEVALAPAMQVITQPVQVIAPKIVSQPESVMVEESEEELTRLKKKRDDLRENYLNALLDAEMLKPDNQSKPPSGVKRQLKLTLGKEIEEYLAESEENPIDKIKDELYFYEKKYAKLTSPTDSGPTKHVKTN